MPIPSTDDFKVTTTKLPTYLGALRVQHKNVRLVYLSNSRKESVLSAPLQPPITTLVNESILSELDLTGNPLYTELGANDSVLNATVTLEKPPSWTQAEACQFSANIRKIRSYLNKHLQALAREDLDKVDNLLVFGLCNGQDTESTVGLGVHRTGAGCERVLVHLLPCEKESSERRGFQYLRKQHLGRVRRDDVKVRCSIIKCYYLVGYNLRNAPNFAHSEIEGSVLIEQSNSEERLLNSVYRANLQVIIGHPNSPMAPFHRDLRLLQSFLETVAFPTIDGAEVVVSPDDYLEGIEAVGQVRDLIANVNLRKKEVSSSLDLKNLRGHSFLDKLWDILKFCKDLSDLKTCFHTLFEELAEGNRMINVDDDKSTVAKIISRICKGTLAVPTLGFFQCLELLVELGLEKLREDYVTIIRHFHDVAVKDVQDKWRELCEDPSAQNPEQSSKRKTRLTLKPGNTVTDLRNSKLKLFVLNRMHTVSELFLFGEEHLGPKLTENDSGKFHQAVCDKFLSVSSSSQKLGEVWLCEFSCGLEKNSAEPLLQDKSLSSETIEMSATAGSSDITSVHHFSEYPIFPNSVINSWQGFASNANLMKSIPDDRGDEKFFYGARMLKYVERI